MSLFWVIFPVVVFFIVLSWTDLKSHIGYAFCVSATEGWWKFPMIWVQSFFIPVCFLSSEKSKIDFDAISTLERALRLAFSDPDITVNYDVRRERYEIIGKRTLIFEMPEKGSVEINGYDKLIPPRLAFMMMAIRERSQKQLKKEKTKRQSLIG